MKDRSTMTTFEFLLSIAWKYVIGFIWYKNLLFRVLPHWDVYDSLQLLLIMMLVSVACFIIVMNRRKNGWTATACFVLPFGLYTMLTYSTTSALIIRVVAVVSILLSLVYSILLFSRKIKQRGKIARRKVLQSRLLRCMYSALCIMAVGMVFLMVGIGWNSYFGTGLVTSSVEAEALHQDIKDEDTMEANMSTVLKLQPAVWEDLNTRERIDVLQTVCNVETHYLGLNDPVTVQGDNLSPYTLGAYSDAQKLIRINLDHIENDPVEEVLSTLLHEIHHSYEHRLADVFDNISPEYRELRLFKDATHYSQEVDDYINPREDYYGYMTQRLEMDSEKYAELGTQEYYARIADWIEDNGTESFTYE